VRELTLAIIKPNAVRKNAAGKIISMWESRGFEIRAIRKVRLSREQAEGFYAEHMGKEFFGRLIEFMTSGPVYLLVLEKEDAVQANRDLMGVTNPANASEGSIRKLYGDNLTQNAVHGSDSAASAAREVSYFFNVFDLTGA